MAIKVGLLLFLVCTTLIPIGRGLAETVIDVTKFGAKPNGKVDSTMAMMRAWNKACHSPGPAKLLIPRGKFKTGETVFQGPCTASKRMTVEIQGTLIADNDLSAYTSFYSGTDPGL